MHNVIIVRTLATWPRTVLTKFPHQEGTPHHHNRSHSWPHYDHNNRERSQSLTTDTAWEGILTDSYHTANPTVAGVSATIKGRHLTHHPTTVPAHDTHQLTDTLGDTLTRTYHPNNTLTCLRHTAFFTGVTLKTIPQTEANLVWDSLPILSTDHKYERHHKHIHEQQPLINLTARRRSPFMINNQTLPKNQTSILIL